MFPSTWEKYSNLIGMDSIVCVEGRVDKQNGDVKIIVDRVKTVEFSTLTSPMTVNPGKTTGHCEDDPVDPSQLPREWL